jgi:hypothetical protein
LIDGNRLLFETLLLPAFFFLASVYVRKFDAAIRPDFDPSLIYAGGGIVLR